MAHSSFRGLIAAAALLAANAQAGVIFHVDVDTHVEPRENTQKAPADSHVSYDVTLGNRFILVKSAKDSTVYDFDKRRRTVVDNEAKTRVDYSLFDTVGFRLFELRNRDMLGKVMASAKVAPDLMGQVDNEHILAIQDKPSSPLLAKTDGTTETFSHDSKPFFTRSLQATPVTPEDARMFAQFLRYQAGGHPQILAALASGGAIPSKLVLTTYNVGTTTRSLRISAVRPSDEPLTDVTAFAPRPPAAAQDPLDQVLDRATALTDKDIAAARARAQDQLASLLRNGHTFDAFLANIEFTLMTGEPLTPLAPEQKSRVLADPSVQALSAALAPPKTKEGLAAAVRVLTELRSNSQAKPHVLKIFEANDRAMLGDLGAARTLFVEALTANPYIAGAYKDLGDVLLRGFDTPRAWRCWDQGRKLAPAFRNFRDVNQFENSLADNHPEFF